MIKIRREEQETAISWLRDDKMAEIYTSDTTMIARLRRLAKVEGSQVEIRYDDDLGITAYLPRGLVSIRAKKRKVTMTEEQKQANAERLRAWREEQDDPNGL